MVTRSNTISAMMTAWIWIVALSSANTAWSWQDAASDAPLAVELREMGKRDQKHRQQIQDMVGKQLEPGSAEADNFSRLLKEQTELDAENVKRLEVIVQQHGWPGIKQVGVEAATAAFLIIQHANLELQEKYLPILRDAQQHDNLKAAEFAMLEDRVLMRRGRPQIYGTQLSSSENAGLQLYPIDDEPYVDLRRQRIGLPPISEYLKLFQKEYQPSNILFEPVWTGDIVYGESSVLLQESPDSPYTARVAFPVDQLIAVRTSDRQKTIPLDQINVDDTGYLLSIPRTLELNGLNNQQLYPPTDSPNSYKYRKGHPEQSMLYGPGKFFHEHQLEITYKHKPTKWSAEPPSLATELLPRTIAKLKAGNGLIVGVSGDSISTGADASAVSDSYPHQPGYVELVGQKLRRITKGQVQLVNRAVGGWSVAHGVGDLDNLLAAKPELIIIAYGMNDVGRRDPTWFGQQIDLMLEKIKATDPNIEVILVASMVGHSEWVHTPREMFEPYRDELKKRVKTGIALADVTAVWLELLKHKHDLDLTGNGLNHPNDFGHRLYAQTIMSLIAE